MTGDYDYSESWHPINIVTRELDATLDESIPLSEIREPTDPAFVPASSDQLKTLQQKIKETTLEALALSKHEADYLAGFKVLSRRVIQR